MPYPRLEDDGQTVMLDLHGATVSEAVALTRSVVHEASRRGRSSVKLVHGHSTSNASGASPTIKHALHRMLDEGRLAPLVTGAWRSEGYLLLSLDVTTATDPTPIRLLDIL